MNKSHKLLIELLEGIGVGNGEQGYIEHCYKGKLIKDTLTFDGELILGFDAIHDLVNGLRSEIEALKASSK